MAYSLRNRGVDCHADIAAVTGREVSDRPGVRVWLVLPLGKRAGRCPGDRVTESYVMDVNEDSRNRYFYSCMKTKGWDREDRWMWE